VILQNRHSPSGRRLPALQRSRWVWLAVAASLMLPAVALAQAPSWILGTNGPDRLNGTAADDSICGLDGDDVIHGGAGRDRIIGDGSRYESYGYVSCSSGNIDNASGRGNDTLYADSGPKTLPSNLFGGAGDDVLVGGPGFDFLIGGQDDDRIRASGGSPGSTRDYLVGAKGNDTLTGSSDGDVISGGTGNNVLNGGRGNDDLFAGKGKSKYYAGRGDDFVLSRNKVRERIECGAGRDKVNADKRDVLVRCEKRVMTGALGPAKERPNFNKSPSGGGGGGGR
jgi:serralysin